MAQSDSSLPVLTPIRGRNCEMHESMTKIEYVMASSTTSKNDGKTKMSTALDRNIKEAGHGQMIKQFALSW
jgi:hypothetical protein